MKFAIFVAFCAVLTKAQAASVAKHTNTATHPNIEDVKHNSSVIGYNYQRPMMPFNYPKVENTHTKFHTFEVETNLNDPLEESKSHINASKRLVGKTSYKAYTRTVCCFKIEKDLQAVIAQRNQRRPPERRLMPYTEILTYA